MAGRQAYISLNGNTITDFQLLKYFTQLKDVFQYYRVGWGRWKGHWRAEAVEASTGWSSDQAQQDGRGGQLYAEIMTRLQAERAAWGLGIERWFLGGLGEGRRVSKNLLSMLADLYFVELGVIF